MSFFQKFFAPGSPTSSPQLEARDSPSVDTSDGTINFEEVQGGNDPQTHYQEASGAPVESVSPLGYHVGSMTVMLLNFGQMVGIGIYAMPPSILKGVGSIGLSLIFWSMGLLLAGVSFAVYLEFASYFPKRSGSQVVYLEQAFPRPRYLMPITFAVHAVMMSFGSATSIVFAEYLFAMSDHKPTEWELKSAAVAGYTLVTLLVIFHTKFSYQISNGLGILKLLTLVFIAITGLVVLGGHTGIADPTSNFRSPFTGTTNSTYGVTNALLKIIYTYSGYSNAFNVAGEIKNPVRTLKINGMSALVSVTILNILVVIAYYAAIPMEQILNSRQTVASQFFENVFGNSTNIKAFNLLIALSAFGNILVSVIGHARVTRECGRQGVLPFPAFWLSTRPFNTPLGSYFIKWLITGIMIVAPPAGDAFNFTVDLQIYPYAFFNLLMTIGLFLVRRRRSKLGLPPSEFRAWNAVVILKLLLNLYLLVMPWVPPPEGQYAGDVSFWYATYCAAGLGILCLCGVYYYTRVKLLPRARGYRIRHEVLQLENGAAGHQLVNVPLVELEAWDREHDDAGNLRKRPVRTVQECREATENEGQNTGKESA